MEYDDLDQLEKDMMDTILTLYFNNRLQQRYKSAKMKGKQNYNNKSKSFVTTGGDQENTSSEIDRFVTNKAEYAQRAIFLRLLLVEVHGAVATLKTDGCLDDYKLMKWSYIYKEKKTNSKITNEDIAERLDISEWTVRERKKELIIELFQMIDFEFYILNPLQDIAEYFQNLLIDD